MNWEKKLKNIYTKHLSSKIKQLVFILNETTSKELDSKTIKLINFLIESLGEFKQSKLAQIEFMNRILNKDQLYPILTHSDKQIKKIDSLMEDLRDLKSLKEEDAQNIILSLDKLREEINTEILEEIILLNKLKY